MKKKNNNHPIFADEIKRTFPIYALGMVFHVICIYILYKIPSIIGEILDLLLAGNAEKEVIMNQVYRLIFYSIIMIIPRILYRVLYFRRARISDTYLRKKVVEHLQYVKPEYYDKEEKGAYLAYLSNEILMIRKFLGNVFFYVTRLILAPIIGILMIGEHVNPILALSVVPCLPIAIIWIIQLYKKLNEKIEKARVVNVELSNTIEQNTSGFSLIKLYNEQKHQKEKFQETNQKAYIADYEIGVIKNKISNVINILYAACYCLGFGIGVYLIQKNTITIGDLTVYISCISVALSEITNSIESLLNGIAYFKQAKKRYNYFFNLDTYKQEGKELQEIEKIEVNHLTYCYSENMKPVLQDISMEILKGEKIGIVGQIGAGKTTLMNILAGFYEVPNQTIKINGIDIQEYSRESIFKKIGYAMQKSIILDENIKNNIDMKQEKEEETIKNIIAKSELLEDVEKMEEKLETNLGENGSKVSGGQKQRIQIARTLLETREVNIFDDSLSALDSKTEKKVLQAIEQEVGANILIVVSNKISMMKNMDKIYVLVEGEIQDMGTHEELLQNNSLYQELSQYEREGEEL
ncbi:MAG: ABC transporter ATP-binding protein [Clostridia bacterium]|nr:ABC transporter ATP-binding protein [Clostridia bacterium]